MCKQISHNNSIEITVVEAVWQDRPNRVSLVSSVFAAQSFDARLHSANYHSPVQSLVPSVTLNFAVFV